MSKIIDITDKLSFDTNPVIKIKGQEIEVQADAETMLKIMGLFQDDEDGTQAALKAAELIFSEADHKKIKKLKLSMKDYMILIQAAMDAAMGGNEESGEQ